jgi:hypothetical protein
MAYDTVGMNVVISTIVEDLDTTLTGMQAAIALYAVVMAAFNWPPCARAVRLLGEVGTYSQRA